MSFLCRVGLHRWSRAQIHMNFESNVKDYEKRCLDCGKVKRWNVIG